MKQAEFLYQQSVLNAKIDSLVAQRKALQVKYLTDVAEALRNGEPEG